MAKKILNGVGIVLGMLLLAAVALVLWLTVTEYRPDAVEEVEVQTDEMHQSALNLSSKSIRPGESLTVLSLNTGYAGLGASSDFFMDGGKSVHPTNLQRTENILGLHDFVANTDADVFFLQEVDTGSKRSNGANQAQGYQGILNTRHGGNTSLYVSIYALNYSCNFVPYPWPPIGKVHSGVQTLSGFAIGKAERIALPCPFKWPVSAANLKRCLLVSYVPLENSDKQLVLVNLHLEAYDDGEGKAAQTQMLMEFLTSEYEKGNYVIAGGDFNQTFPGALDAFPIKDTDLWTPGVLEGSILPEGWQFAYDLETPSCRLLNQPYDPDSPETQFYVIDGFILSPNVELKSVETLDAQFTYTDHNPVRLEVTLA